MPLARSNSRRTHRTIEQDDDRVKADAGLKKRRLSAHETTLGAPASREAGRAGRIGADVENEPEVEEGDAGYREYEDAADDDAAESDDTGSDSSDDGEGGESLGADGDNIDDDDDYGEELAKLKDVPFGELLRLSRDGRENGASLRPDEKRHKLSAAIKAVRKAAQEVRLHRVNKNRPAEVSSKVPVPKLREVVPAQKKVVRDPRFESLSGKLEDDKFRHRYAFLYDEVLPGDKQRLSLAMKREKVPAEKERLKRQLQRVEQQMRDEESRRSAEQREKARRRGEKDAVKGGKRPFYLKKGERKKEELIAKFQELKAKGKLQSFMEKKRKKLTSKDRALVPSARADRQNRHGPATGAE